MFGQRMILCHSDNVQPFHKDRLVLAYDLCREFLKRIPSSIADSGVEFRYSQFGISAVIAAFDLARQSALEPFQTLFSPDQRTRIFNLLAIAGRRKRFNADIYTDFGFGPRPFK